MQRMVLRELLSFSAGGGVQRGHCNEYRNKYDRNDMHILLPILVFLPEHLHLLPYLALRVSSDTLPRSLFLELIAELRPKTPITRGETETTARERTLELEIQRERWTRFVIGSRGCPSP